MSNTTYNSRQVPAARRAHEWLRVLLYAILISAVVLGLFYYWFVTANRHIIFLYGHLGAAPFDDMTNGRYWMSGLVASGGVMIGWLLWHWFTGRLVALRYRRYDPPVWWQVWLLCLPPLAVGIPLITMSGNHPTLPLPLAASCAAVTLVGLAFALWPGAIIAQRPAACGWLGLYGLGLMPLLLLLRSVELPARGLSTTTNAWLAAGGSLVGSWCWLALVSFLHTRRASPVNSAPPVNSASQLLAAGICVSYLVLPLFHHLFFTPPDYRYITTSGNFFAFNPVVQIASFAAACATAVWIARRQQFLRRTLST